MQQGWGKIALKLLFYAIVALFFTGVIFVSASKAKADSPGHIVINEIYPAPDSKCDTSMLPGCDKEWIELYNPTSSVINLATYTIEDGNHVPKLLSGNILSGGYNVLISGTDFTFGLNDTGDYVGLKNGSLVDEVSYGDWNDGNVFDNAIKPNKIQSISRIPNGVDTDNDAADFQIVPVTKDSENILPPPVEYSDQIYINELLPQPASGSADEYIELYNSSDTDIDLINWQLDAGTFTSSTIIKSKEYRAFKNPEIKIGLTDTGDTTNLIDPNGDIKSTVIYEKTNRGQSYSKFTDSWQWTTTLTPAAENVLTVEVNIPDQDAPILQTDIAGARNQPDGVTLQITGAVSVVPGKLSSQCFYIQDASSGIQIYNYDKLFPALTVGDQIQAKGEIGSINGERRLKISQISDIIILSTHPPPEPTKTTISKIAENFEGQYISVVGTVTKTSGSTFYIHGSGEIEVSIRVGTGIKKPRMSVGDRVQIAGILSQYGDSYRILPIVQSDVKIISSSGLPNSGPNGVYIIIISIILSWITSAILYRKRRI